MRPPPLREAVQTGLSIEGIRLIFQSVPSSISNAATGEPTSARPVDWKSVGNDLMLLGLLAGVAGVLGWGINRGREHPLPLHYVAKDDRLQQSVTHLAGTPSVSTASSDRDGSAPVTQPEMIDLARFHGLVGSKAIVLDARPTLFYRAGHVPGARALSREAFEADYARQRTALESRRQETLVVYCSGDTCVDSRMVATALQKLGYMHVLVFIGGWEEWQAAGLPEEHG